MNKGCFALDMITPHETVSHQVRALRLVDETGSFGIHNGHCDFLTVLTPAIGSYSDTDGREHYVATNGGILRIADNRATLIADEIVVADDAKRLAVIIRDNNLHRDSAEQRIAQMVEGIESAFFEKLTTMDRDKPG
jgi:alternate F1F0 ATPase F1 subunit epsilon